MSKMENKKQKSINCKKTSIQKTKRKKNYLVKSIIENVIFEHFYGC